MDGYLYIAEINSASIGSMPWVSIYSTVVNHQHWKILQFGIWVGALARIPTRPLEANLIYLLKLGKLRDGLSLTDGCVVYLF